MGCLMLVMPVCGQQQCCNLCQQAIFRSCSDCDTSYDFMQDCYNGGCLLSTCPVGKYKVACDSFDRWTPVQFCVPCPQGTYRSDIAAQPGCSACAAACQAWEVQTVACSPTTNRVCQGCSAGQVVVSNQCVSCGTGFYTDDRLTCKACTICKAPNQRRKKECTSAQNAECESCPTGYVSSGDNQGDCAFCADGYYYGGRGCVVCDAVSAGCLEGQYISCGSGTRVCVTCTGHLNAASLCPAGKGIATECSGTTLSNAVCQDCGPGKERPEGTPMVDGYQQCLKCGTGKYKIGTSTAACQNCTNKPALNSVYRAWTLTEAADTASCPW